MSRLISCAAALVGFLVALNVFGQDASIAKLKWQFGPGEGVIGDKARIKIPQGYAFLNAGETAKFKELTHNIVHGDEYLIAPESLNWFAMFRFNSVGYVKDDETIDADAVLKSVRQGNEQSNEERRKRGWSTMSLLGWRFRPQYDSQSKLLEWAFLGKDDSSNEQVVNYNTRILGRTGVMSVVVVTDPLILDQSVADFKRTIGGYGFVPGERYSEFKAGDHVAEFGLAALIAGGAAAVATKKGFWAVLAGFFAAAWKFIVGIAVAAVAGLGRLFKRKSQ